MLIQKDKLFDYIMENCQDIIFAIDTDFNYITCNRAFLKHLKFHHKSEVLNKNTDEILPSDSKDIIKNYLKSVLIDREPKTYTYKQGLKVFKQTAIPIIENCEIVGILSFSTDITKEEDLKFKLIEKICELNNTLEKEEILKSQNEMFLATLTHDLKNPVMALSMTLKMLKNGIFGMLNTEQTEILDTAIESSEFMQNLLCSILATYKLDNGAIELVKSNFDIDELINKCIKENSALAQDRHIMIKYVNPIKCNIYADEVRIRRVIGNLINNGLSHADKNTEFTINILKQDNKLIFKFTNIGNPIPENLKNHIFEKYVTGENLTGTGLGLYFSKKVIEAHDGIIYLQTENNKITFTFELPLTNTVKSTIVKF